MRLACALLVLVGGLTVPAWGGAGAGPSWLPEVEKLLAAPGGGAAAVARLEKLPLEERKTRSYQWALARARQAADEPGPVAEAVALLGVMPPDGGPGAELEPLARWLSKRAAKEYGEAVAAQQKKDLRAAVKAYLQAVKLDASILARDDHGLGAAADRALASMVERKKDDPSVLFRHAFHCYRTGRLPEAEGSLRKCLALEKDPYRRWAAQVWLDRVGADRAAARAQDEKMAADEQVGRARRAREEAQAARAAASAAAALPATAAPDPTAARRRQLEQKIAELDAMIADPAGIVKEAAGELGQKYGRLIDRYAGTTVVRRKVDELKAQRDALQQELDGLR